MEINLTLKTESGRGVDYIQATLTEADLEALMQGWIDERYQDTVLTALTVDSIQP